nr:hypothetical protein [Nostoc commune]
MIEPELWALLLGLFPVIPQINCPIGSGSGWRKSTQWNRFMNLGTVFISSSGQPGRITKPIRSFRCTNSTRNSFISISAHGPTPDEPINMAAALICEIIVSSWSCQGRNGSKSYLSSQASIPSCNSCALIFSTSAFSLLLWQRKTSFGSYHSSTPAIFANALA